jgi:pyruvate formate lyase activating enzyme
MIGNDRLKVFDIERLSMNNGPGIRSTVYLKGCPLNCEWCHNPESISPNNQVMYIKNLCTECRACERACMNDAINADLTTNVSKCIVCGRCVNACNYRARRMCGFDIEIPDLVDELMRDDSFFQQSSGGVTISGGEPFFQSRSLNELIKMLKQQNVHIAIDTSGYSEFDTFSLICKQVNLILFDIKHMDDEKHKKMIGVSNEKILKNLKWLAKTDIAIKVRYPMIKGKNDGPENISRTAAFLLENGIYELDVIPYHDIAQGKFLSLGLPEQTRIIKHSESEIVEKTRLFCEEGINVSII